LCQNSNVAEELVAAVSNEMRRKFDESIEHHLGPAALSQDFLSEELTPNSAYFDNTNVMDSEYGDAKITP
jgi:hypothetical protein